MGGSDAPRKGGAVLPLKRQQQLLHPSAAGPLYRSTALHSLPYSTTQYPKMHQTFFLCALQNFEQSPTASYTPSSVLQPPTLRAASYSILHFEQCPTASYILSSVLQPPTFRAESYSHLHSEQCPTASYISSSVLQPPTFLQHTVYTSKVSSIFLKLTAFRTIVYLMLLGSEYVSQLLFINHCQYPRLRPRCQN